MVVKALCSFTGNITMRFGEVKTVDDNDNIKCLINDGYLEVIETDSKCSSTSKKRSVRKNESK